MSEIQTFYPTSGMSERTCYTVTQALYNCVNEIAGITDFFDSVTMNGADIGTTISDFWIKFKKGNSYISISCYNSSLSYIFRNNETGSSSSGSRSDSTSYLKTIDIPVRFVQGVNGTGALWLDEFNKGIVAVFNKYGDKCFLANSTDSGSYSFYYSDTGGNVSNLTDPFNGDNISKAAEYIAQPYYHLGINTDDIYTFDGGGANIPWGKFNLGDSEFVRLTGNFALRIK